MQHVSRAADRVVDQAADQDQRYPLTGTITEYDIRQTSKDGSNYVVLTFDRGQGKRPIKAVAFDDKFDQVMDLIDQRRAPIRLFGFFENREYSDRDTGEILTSHRYRILWAGVPRPRTNDAEGGPQRQRNGGRQQAQQGQRPRNGQQAASGQGQQRPRNGNGQGNPQSQQRPRNGNRQRQAQQDGDWWPN